MKFDDILLKLGGFGRYQKLLILAFVIFYPGNNWQLTSINFLAGDMDHWCKLDASGKIKNYSKDLFIPKTIDEFGKNISMKCEMYDVNITDLENQDVDLTKLIPTSNWTRVPCRYGWEYDRTTEFYSTIVSQFTLICDRAWLQSIPATSFVLGLLVGSIFPGYMSDIWGRKWTTVIMIIGQMVCTLAEAFSPYFWMFVGLRFFGGFFNIGAYQAFWVLLIENMSPAYRNHCTYYVTLGLILEFILPIIAYYVRNHIHLHLVSLGMALPGLICAIIAPKSPRWLLSRKRYTEYNKVAQCIAKINNVTKPEEITEQTNYEEDKVADNASILDLLRTPRLRQRTMILWFIWFSMSFIFYAFSTNVGTLIPGNIYLNMVIVTAGYGVPTFVTMWIALFKSGRRMTIIIYSLITGVCCLLMIPLILVSMELLVTIAAVMAMAALSTYMQIVYLYTGEIYPTPARTIGFGVASSIGRIAALLSTQLPHLKHVWFGLPYVCLSVFPIVSSALAYFLPETKDQHLPETFEEAEKFGTPEYKDFDKNDTENTTKPLPFIVEASTKTTKSNNQV